MASRLIVHIGPVACGGDRLRAALAANADPLAAAGVRVLELDGLALAQCLASDARALSDEPLAAITSALADPGVDVLVVSADELEAVLQLPRRLQTLRQLANRSKVRLEVVVVAREQVGWINDDYIHQVVRARLRAGFQEYLEGLIDWPRFNLPDRFEYAMTKDDVRFRAVRHAHFAEHGSTRVITDLLDLPVADLAADDGIDPRWGTRAMAIAAFVGRAADADEVPLDDPWWRSFPDRLFAEVAAHGWTKRRFWGWTDELAEAVAGRFAGSNDAFARAVWGQPWSDDFDRTRRRRSVPRLIDLTDEETRAVWRILSRL